MTIIVITFNRLITLPLLTCLALLGSGHPAMAVRVAAVPKNEDDAILASSVGVSADNAAPPACARTAAGLASSSSSSREADPSKVAAGGVVDGVRVVVVVRGRSRELATSATFQGDTSKTANSTGNPSGCGQVTTCANGCQTLFYKVTGGNGSDVTASICENTTFAVRFYVWEGNGGTCASFTCVTAGSIGCGSDQNLGYIAWTAETGAEYYVQVWGVGTPGVGPFTLTVSSDAPIEAAEVDVCGTTHSPPTASPTDAPTDAPTEVVVPTAPPSKSPTVSDPCAGVGATYWLYDPTTNSPIRKLSNNSVACFLHPYNIEVRPCNAATVASNPVRVRLVDATGGPPLVVHKSKPQRSAPYFLFGPAPTRGDVLPSPQPLRNGVYHVAAKGAPEWGKLKFTQNCPCPDGTKKRGKKGCMM